MNFYSEEEGSKTVNQEPDGPEGGKDGWGGGMGGWGRVVGGGGEGMQLNDASQVLYIGATRHNIQTLSAVT